MISEGLRKHAFWLYGVIVGLAIKDALEVAVGHLIVPPDGSLRDAVPETVRLLVFLMTAIQFYLGSVWFFDKYHDTLPPDEQRSGYAVDFLFGLVHFLIFFAWALSLDTHKGHLHLFPILLFVVLMYDCLWCRACSGRTAYVEIKKWTYVNFGVLVGAITLYSVTYLLLLLLSLQGTISIQGGDPIRHRIAEVVAMIPILIVSGVDIIGMISDKQIIADWFLATFKRHEPV